MPCHIPIFPYSTHPLKIRGQYNILYINLLKRTLLPLKKTTGSLKNKQ
jgi:hypothetical protein